MCNLFMVSILLQYTVPPTCIMQLYLFSVQVHITWRLNQSFSESRLFAGKDTQSVYRGGHSRMLILREEPMILDAVQHETSMTMVRQP